MSFFLSPDPVPSSGLGSSADHLWKKWAIRGSFLEPLEVMGGAGLGLREPGSVRGVNGSLRATQALVNRTGNSRWLYVDKTELGPGGKWL